LEQFGTVWNKFGAILEQFGTVWNKVLEKQSPKVGDMLPASVHERGMKESTRPKIMADEAPWFKC
jgi:hypothetical protein